MIDKKLISQLKILQRFPHCCITKPDMRAHCNDHHNKGKVIVPSAFTQIFTTANLSTSMFYQKSNKIQVGFWDGPGGNCTPSLCWGWQSPFLVLPVNTPALSAMSAWRDVHTSGEKKITGAGAPKEKKTQRNLSRHCKRSEVFLGGGSCSSIREGPNGGEGKVWGFAIFSCCIKNMIVSISLKYFFF